jgi:hypothetical protein
MPSDASSVKDFTISGNEAPRAPDRAPEGEDCEVRARNPVVGEDLLGERLVAAQHEAARVAARVGDAQELEIRHHVLIVRRQAVELLEEIEGDVRLPLLDRLADDPQVAPDPERAHLVAELAQRAHDVVLRLPWHCQHVGVARRPAAPNLVHECEKQRLSRCGGARCGSSWSGR